MMAHDTAQSLWFCVNMTNPLKAGLQRVCETDTYIETGLNGTNLVLSAFRALARVFLLTITIAATTAIHPPSTAHA
jgi:hypothetical protein